MLHTIFLAASALSLADLEQMAVERNPAVARAAAGVASAEGRQRQAGAYPNPVVGLNADEVNGGPTIRYGEWGGFASQQIVMGGKRGLDRRIAAQDTAAAQAHARAERQRVVNTARSLFYQAMADQRLIEVRTELEAIAKNAVKIARELANVGQADQPDVLAAEIEAERATLAVQLARNGQARTWRQIAALVDRPMTPQPVEGNFEQVPVVDVETVQAALDRESPEVQVASAAVARAEAAVRRAEVEIVPDLEVRSGLRYNRELLELNRRPVGLETFLDIGVRIPVFNRNQGNIAAAKADREAARLDARRVALSLRSRLAAAHREYLNATQAAARYGQEMIPRAQTAYDTYLRNFRAMAAAYPMALNAQRNLFALREQHVEALTMAWQAVVELQGLLVGHGH